MNKLSCILLVDDDDTTNFINQLLLEDLQVTEQVLIATNGWEALQLIKLQWRDGDCPQLILLDLNMPEMDGLEFLKAYEELEFDQKQAVVIVVLTTSENPGDVERLQKSPIKGVINKPLTEKKVQDLLRLYFNEEIG
ncbi:response regulator [Cesiribacter sp. SM1]|uniref:response regulator n=1 Tax=Cesiribacter sp. SM1 TaxID=2861196 RepID=UPI001CD42DB5|nr:response regulator [Cesiribacter sp. SM1]